jgi:hypothetical protein
MNVLREHAEEQYREELEELKRQDSDLKPLIGTSRHKWSSNTDGRKT